MIAGPGDDCAIIRMPSAGEDLLCTTDLLIEGVHFRRETHTAAAIGYKVLARGLSDIAAMGGRPTFCLISAALPEWAGNRWIDSFYRGLLRLSEEYRTPLVGGDLARAERLTCDIIVCGSVPKGKALRRNGARPGDAIFVSGTLGGSALGLSTGTGAAWQRHLRPVPRLKLGEHLRKKMPVTAAMDLSDGLSIDLHRLCRESGVAATIDRPLPAFHGASLDQVLSGGEDYELLFTVKTPAKVPSRIQGIPLTRIGTVEQGTPGRIRFFGRPLAPAGYDHFRKP